MAEVLTLRAGSLSHEPLKGVVHDLGLCQEIEVPLACGLPLQGKRQAQK